MNKYSDIEIQTANNLLRDGYKWLVRNMRGSVIAFSDRPYKNENRWVWPINMTSDFVSGKSAPLFQNIQHGDEEPTYIEDIVSSQILDEAERRYLSAVIRPFRDNVKSIVKCNLESNQEFIAIYYKNGEATFLPCFEAGTMYKGIESCREYTLEELGL